MATSRKSSVRRKPSSQQPAITSDLSVFTAAQRRVFCYCETLARLHAAEKAAPGGPVHGRFWPLVAAPSGSGKSALVRRLADALGYEYLRFQRGDMVPLGAKGTPTQHVILNALVAQKRPLLVHWDELDKFISPDGLPTPTHEWGAGLWSCLYSCLDGAFNVTGYLRVEPAERAKPLDPETPVTEEFLRRRLRDVFQVGSGTWQTVFEQSAKRGLGFDLGASPADTTAADLLRSRQIAAELFLRFHAEVQIMDHPSKSEIAELLKRTGLRRLADDLGYRIQEEEIDFTTRGGFRALETLYTRLLIRQREIQSATRIEPERTKTPLL